MNSPLRRRDLFYAALLAALSVLYFGPVLFFGQTFHGGDHGVLNLPLFHWLHARYAQGLPVAWMGGVACGDPVQDALLTPEFYPPLKALILACGPVRAYNLNATLHFMLAVLGCYALARQHRASPEAAWLAALAGGLCGGMAYSLPWWTILVTLGWLPWMFVGLALAQSGPRLRWAGAALLGLAVGLGFSGGYPGMVVYAVLPLALLHLHWAWRARGPRTGAWLAIAAAALIAALLATGPLIGLGRLHAASTRGQALSYGESAENSMSPAALAQVVAPHAFGRLGDDSYLGVSWRLGSYEPQGMLLYVGLLGLVLGLYGAAADPRRHAPWLAALGILLVYALGHWTPAYAWFFRLPLLDHLRAPVKAGAFAGVLLCVPIAHGFDRLRLTGSRRPALLLLALGAVLLAAALALALGQARWMELGRAYIDARIVEDPIHQKGAAYYAGKLARWMAGARIHLAFQGLMAVLGAWALARPRRDGSRAAALALGLLLFTELWVNGTAAYARVDRSLHARPPDSLARLEIRPEASPRVLTWGSTVHVLSSFPRGWREGDLEGERLNLELPPGNVAAAHGFEQYNGYSPGALRRSMALFGWFRDHVPGSDMKIRTAELLRHRRLWNLGAAGHVLSSVPLQAGGLELVHDGRVKTYRNLQAAPLAYFADGARGIEGMQQALALLRGPDTAGLGPRPALLEGEGPFPAGPGRAQWRGRDDAAWDLDVEAGPRGGTVVLARTHYEGLFKATLDGHPVRLWPANGAFSAVVVPAGRHRLSVDLDHAVLRRQQAFFWAGLAAALAAAAWSWSASRRPRARS